MPLKKRSVASVYTSSKIASRKATTPVAKKSTSQPPLLSPTKTTMKTNHYKMFLETEHWMNNALQGITPGITAERIVDVIDGLDCPGPLAQRTPLLMAVDANRIDVVRLLLAQGSPDTSAVTPQGQSALHLAASNGNMEMVALLVEACGCDVTATDEDDMSPFALAVREDHDAVAEYLIDKGIPPYALHWAAYGGLVEVARYLLSNGCDANYTLIEGNNKNGNTPLHVAIEDGKSYEMVELLLSHGANPHALGLDNLTPLHLACREGLHGVVRLLVSKGVRLSEVDTHFGDTALHDAIKGGHRELSMLLIELGADPHIPNAKQEYPLHLASRNQWADVVQLMVSKGVPVDVLDGMGDTALNWSIRLRHKEMALLLLKLGSNPNRPTYEQQRSIFELNSRLSASKGTAPDAYARIGFPPLYWALKYSDGDMALRLLELGADPIIRGLGNSRISSLHLACEVGLLDVANYLLLHCSDISINETDAQGHSPLNLAILSGSRELIFRLIELGADPNVANQHKQTSLHLACRLGMQDVVAVLVANGVPLNEVDSFGKTPLKFVKNCRGEHHETIGRYLKYNGAV